jgi:alkylated DNA repair dioxygenase AlkB
MFTRSQFRLARDAMPTPELAGFTSHDLGEGLTFLTGTLPPELAWDPSRFEAVWALHPTNKHVIQMPGGPVETPRWQQAYGADYHYTGRTNVALPVPEVLHPLREWARAAIEPRLNGLLLNWYEGAGHYIGEHHDSTRDMVPDTPIVTVSFGETRVFRLSRDAGGVKAKRDFPATDGAVFVLPYATNLAWKHSVPKSARYTGRRISVTLRAFVREGDRPKSA